MLLRGAAESSVGTAESYILAAADIPAGSGALSLKLSLQHTDVFGFESSVFLQTIVLSNNVDNTGNPSPSSGTVSIVGDSFVIDGKLTASVTITDANGFGGLSYQWEGGDAAGVYTDLLVGDATASVYTIPLNWPKDYVSVRVEVVHTDGLGYLSTITSAARLFNQPTNGALVIDITESNGNRHTPGAVFVANIAGFADGNGLGQVRNYAWVAIRGAQEVMVSGATNDRYTVDVADFPQVAGNVAVRLEVDYADAFGFMSALSATERFTHADSSGAVVVLGDAFVADDILTADINAVRDVNGLGQFVYQWQGGGDNITADIAGADSATYTLPSSGWNTVHVSVRVSVRHSDALGDETVLISGWRLLNQRTEGMPLVELVNNVAALSGATASVNIGSISDGNSNTDGGTYAYEWLGVAGNSTNQTYTLQAADISNINANNPPRVSVFYMDSLGFVSRWTVALQVVRVALRRGSSEEVIAEITEPAGVSAENYSYQWQQSNSESGSYTDIASAPSASVYRIGQGYDAAKPFIRLSLSYQRAGSGVRYPALSSPLRVAGITTGALVMQGNGYALGAIYTADISDLRDIWGNVPEANDLTYEWQRGASSSGGWVPIANKIDRTYTLSALDFVNSESYLRVMAIDKADYRSQSVTLTTAARDINAATEGAISISITPSAGGSYALSAVYTAITNKITDNNGIGAFAYEWLLLREGAESSVGAAESYTLAAADIPAGSGALSLKLSLQHTDAFGFESSVFLQTIELSDNINTPGNPSPSSGTVSIVGDSFVIDGELTASVTLTDSNGFGSLSYQWEGGNAAGVYTDLAVGDATASVYTIPATWPTNYVSVRVEVVHTDGLGYLSTITSAARLFNQPTEGAISISITPSAGGSYALSAVYTAVTNKITDDNGIGAFAYEWLLLRAGAESSVGAAESYILAAADILAGGGGVLSLKLSLQHTDAFGFESSVFLQTIVLSNNVDNTGNPSPSSGTVSIVGDSFIIGGKLTASVTLTDANGFGGLSYKWEGGNAAGVYADLAVGDATASVYTIPANWPKDYVSVRVEVVHTDGLGYLSTITSTARLFNQPTEGAISISITPSAGGSYALSAVYTAVTNKITDDNGIGAFAYEWLLLRAGAESSVGAAESYILAAADILAGGGGVLSLKLSLRHTDAFGFESSVFLRTIELSDNINTPGNPLPSSGTVSIVGDSFIIGGKLTASVTLTDANGFGGLSYKWEGGDAAGVYTDLAVGDATASVYTIPATWPSNYVSVRVEVVHTDGLGYLSTITSAARLFNQPTEGAISISITPSAGGSYALSAVYTAVTNSVSIRDTVRYRCINCRQCITSPRAWCYAYANRSLSGLIK